MTTALPAHHPPEEALTGRLTLVSTDPARLQATLAHGLENRLGDGVLSPGTRGSQQATAPDGRHQLTVEQDACAPLWCSHYGDEVCAGCEDTVVMDLDTEETACGPCLGLPH